MSLKLKMQEFEGDRVSDTRMSHTEKRPVRMIVRKTLVHFPEQF
jgi:hypothetical protein